MLKAVLHPHNADQFPMLPTQLGGYHDHFGGAATPVPSGQVNIGRSNSSKRGLHLGGFGTVGRGPAFGNDEYGMDEDDYMDVPIPGFAPAFPAAQQLQHTPVASHAASQPFREPNESHVKRARMMKLDPQCARKIA